METITINTYDPANRFNMDDEQASQFFQYVEKTAIAEGYAVSFTSAIYVDQLSEDFVSKCFENYCF